MPGRIPTRVFRVLRKPVCERNKKLKISCQTPFNTHWEQLGAFSPKLRTFFTGVPARDTPYSRYVIPLFSCPLSWSVHYNFSGDGSCRFMMEAVVPSWKLSRLLTVAMSKQDISARKLKCNFFIMVYKSLLTNVFTWCCLILNKICGRKSATWPWHMAASPNPIRWVH